MMRFFLKGLYLASFLACTVNVRIEVVDPPSVDFVGNSFF